MFRWLRTSVLVRSEKLSTLFPFLHVDLAADEMSLRRRDCEPGDRGRETHRSAAGRDDLMAGGFLFVIFMVFPVDLVVDSLNGATA